MRVFFVSNIKRDSFIEVILGVAVSFLRYQEWCFLFFGIQGVVVSFLTECHEWPFLFLWSVKSGIFFSRGVSREVASFWGVLLAVVSCFEVIPRVVC